MSVLGSDKVPLVRLRGISPDQLRDIKNRLWEKGIAFVEDPPSSPIQQYLYVGGHDLSRAREVLRSEITDFASARRKAWKEEWEHKHGGSYFRWLKHQLLTRPKEAAFRFFNML